MSEPSAKRFKPTYTVVYQKADGATDRFEISVHELNAALLSFHAHRQLRHREKRTDYSIIEVLTNHNPAQKWRGDELPGNPDIGRCTISRTIERTYAADIKELGLSLAIA